MADLFSSDETPPPSPVRPGSLGLAGTGDRPPLAVRMRPRTLDELVGQEHLLGPGSPLRRLAEGADGLAGPASVILWGPPGAGKTTLAHVVSNTGARRFVELSAVTAGVKDVRQVMQEARELRDRSETRTVLFLDEIHRFTKSQQDGLLPGVENRWVILVAATTENPSFSVISPLLSRSLLLTLRQLQDSDVENLLRRAVEDERGLNGTVSLSEDAVQYLVRLSAGDARRALTSLEAAAGSALSRNHDEVTGEDVEQAVDKALVRYDREGDQHYDITSALIKSIRGSDVDAALHYLARMVEAGEDPRFLARRLMISASEDIGMADPTAIQVAVAAAQAVQMIGMPEGRIVLAQATVHLAMAPKSNASYAALNAATQDVRAGLGGPVPPDLRDAHYTGAKKLGHGRGYKYAHDHPHGVVEQQYLPDDLAGREYYQPTDRGGERGMGERLARLRSVLRGGNRRR
ncbi:replication-associated recombination protein A [Kineosporia sp. J2-2]|uniref:Replication-associated recombination protein A n=1 Tax=Kineosporia corallincola TaxID=2835133 RepID=A0ABS5TCZ9_9ACTN|nr:replication-associated recombination protein A [Kineosporia corallincola]MBT0768962.1 replication-associated recombination protein A [Kineosporia corallincola]